MQNACDGPIWLVDDFSPCFYQRYLGFILPVTACAISVFFIISRIILYYLAERRRKSYKLVPSPIVDVHHDRFGGGRDAVEGDTEAWREGVDQEENFPSLYKATSRATDVIFETSKPPGKALVNTIELVSVLGEVGINILALISASKSADSLIPFIARLSAWIYVSILALARIQSFMTPVAKHPSLPKIWNHTAFLYSVQWLYIIVAFRSVLIHPPENGTRRFVVVDTVLSSILLLIFLTTRKGENAVPVQYEEGLTPPKNQTASILSLASYSWMDSLIWKGYKKPLSIEDVWNLTPDAQAKVVLVSYRQIKKTSSMAWSLLKHFDRELLIQGIWAIIAGVLAYAPTVLLKRILEYIEDPSLSSPNAAWLYVFLMFASTATQAVADGQSLWLGRELSVKLRAIVVGELYAKALRRKAGAFAGSTKRVDADQKKSKPRWNIFKKERKKQLEPENEVDGGHDQTPEAEDAQANIGKIINLMAIDSFKVSEICAYLHYLWASVPTQIIVAVVLLYKIMGLSSIAGILTLVLIGPFNMIVAKKFQKAQHRILTSTDARIHSSNEVLQNIRIIKYFAWEKRFEGIINDKRFAELKNLRKRYVLWSISGTIFYATPFLAAFATFAAYTLIEKKKLISSVAFPALSMFSQLRVPLDRFADMVVHVLEAKVSVDRVEKFLSEEDTGKYSQLKASNMQNEPKISLEKATLSWGSSPASTNDFDRPSSALGGVSDAFRLINVDVDFKIGKLNVITGPTGSGKTSMLMALLGEMNLLEGSVSLPGGSSDRTDLWMDPETSLTESVAYCAQEAWLVNDTIKENIVFASAFNESRYQAVIKACSLERDFEILPSGDETPVGEKGIGLSGGQKQRISLARAIYSYARHLLLDDCLSAVDSHTGKHIFHNALMGPLMVNRTCVLVTHNVSLVLPQAEYVVVLDNGRVTGKGSLQELIAEGALESDICQSGPSSVDASRMGSRVQSNLEEIRNESLNGKSSLNNRSSTNGVSKPKALKKKSTKTPVFNDEEKSTGSVPMSTIFMYLRAMGPWLFWVLFVASFFVHQLASLAPNLWVKEWANAYEPGKGSTQEMNENQKIAAAGFFVPNLKFSKLPNTFLRQSRIALSLILGKTKYADIPELYYVAVFGLLISFFILITLLRELVFFWGSLHASKKIHGWLLRSVMRAKFKFFDSTPLGRIMNRFSKDIEAIDQEVAATAFGVLHCLAAVILIVVLISIVTPAFLIAGLFILIIYSALGAFYLNTSRDLKRLESIQRSPLYQQFGETLSGVVTIRAYGDGARFIVDNHSLINTYNRPYIYLWAANRWLAFRIEVTGALVSFFAAMFVILKAGEIDAGSAGLSLTYAITFTEYLLWLVRLYSETQQNMNSVERVEEYMNVEQEAQSIIPETRPPGNWPSRGAVSFSNYSTRYRADLPPVLKCVSFSAQPGERVGIVGRTGAGKSSLALALFRGLEAESGQIIIDDINIGLIGLQDLREAITIVPQDPTLFTGTIRSNLDPFGLYSDENIFTALRQVHLIGPTELAVDSSEVRPGPTPPGSDQSPLLLDGDSESNTLVEFHNNSVVADGNNATSTTASSTSSLRHENKNIFLDLETPVSESGSNLSQGQRQLLCLARALLKSPKVLLMDEATASIDYATDSKIQDTLRELRGRNTILTIAHRLQTIIDYDRVLVLDNGEVIEYDGPWQLITKEGGLFRSMCENSGNMESLMEGAQKAWEQKRLVDDS